MSGRKRIHPHFRQLFTATGRNTGNASLFNVFALTVGSVALGLGGYYMGVRRAIETPPPKPVYGTPEDFARAIEELKALFSEDAVTTDEGQLEAHGFSPNTYLPGTPRHSFTNTWSADIWATFG
jgi:D-lactate dehydrogenase (cytochrome)